MDSRGRFVDHLVASHEYLFNHIQDPRDENGKYVKITGYLLRHAILQPQSLDLAVENKS